MEALVHWFSQNLSQYISPEGAVFIISMIPLLELRGGLLAASLLKISAAKAIPLCIVGNIIPIPFILLFIRQIFKVLKKTKLFRGLVMKLEDRAMRKSDQVKKYEFWGLMLFVGILGCMPILPGIHAFMERGAAVKRIVVPFSYVGSVLLLLLSMLSLSSGTYNPFIYFRF